MIKFALENPVKVFVAVLFIVLFGYTSATNMSYRLIPPIEYPQISVRTHWTGAAPYDMEREIVDPQERKLRTIPGLVDIESMASNSYSSVTMMFEIDTDINDAMLQVLNKLNEVRSYPDDVDNPTIRAANSDGTHILQMQLIATDNDTKVEEFGSYFEEVLRPNFDRIDGVSDLAVAGGRTKEIQININPETLALYGLTISDIATTLTQENLDISAGTTDLGEREFRFITKGEIKTPEDLQEIVILSNDNSRVKFGDIAEVNYGYAKRTFFSKFNGKNAIYIGILAESNADILKLTDTVEETVMRLNIDILPQYNLKLVWLSDQRGYILDSLALVKSNIIIGSILAILVLLIFLRSIRSTIVIAVTIPISVIGTFIILKMFDRSLNVTSLAGIAFSVGMLIDNSIVVLENIDRHLGMGKSPFNAAYDGVKEVWGAVLISTLTTIAVFLPIIFIKEEAGQLFSDIALSVASAVGLSLLVSVIVIPVATKLIYTKYVRKNTTTWLNDRIVAIGNFFIKMLMRVSDKINSSTRNKIIAVLSATVISILITYTLIPKMDYLPKGNKNLVQSFITVPSGLSAPEREIMTDTLYDYLKPYQGEPKDGYPAIEHVSIASGNWGNSIYITSEDKYRAGELVPLIASSIAKLPGALGSTAQSSLFNIGRGSGSEILMYIAGSMSYDDLAAVTLTIQNKIIDTIPGVQIRVNPSATPVWPEIYIIPNREALNAAGVSTSEIGITLDTFIDGRKIDEITDDELGTIDIVMRSKVNIYDNPDQINSIFVNTRDHTPIPISILTETVETLGVDRIRRYNSQRSFNAIITTTETVVLEELVDQIMNNAIAPLRAEGLLDGVEITTSGAASKLVDAQTALFSNIGLAIMITYLLMAALFNNFLYPLIILFTLPLAASGGFLGLGITNIFIANQPLDILTMLGFIMLIGIVVNNAILIVHQSIVNIGYGMKKDEAIRESLLSRVRPIAMSTLSSLCGMLPLIIAPGAGSELYRGLGSVIVGGLGFSTMFTMFIIPALLTFILKDKQDTTQ